MLSNGFLIPTQTKRNKKRVATLTCNGNKEDEKRKFLFFFIKLAKKFT